jgi:S-adenosyl-L-methionine hydrolase (adenosine-forming)
LSPALRPVVFLSDFGHEDEFTGVCRVVIDRISPGIKVIDLSHGIPPGDIRRGALALAAAVGYAAPSVFLAVVDPGVGTARRAIALSAGSHFLVGPDNGLLWLAAERAGGVTAAFDVSDSPAHLEPLMRTFHGRDIFSPVAARLASGDSPASLGEEFEPEAIVRLELPLAEVSDDEVLATVIARDRYGNLTLNVGPEQIESSFLAPGVNVSVEFDREGRRQARGHAADQAVEPTAGPVSETVAFASAFGEVDEGTPLLYADSSGSLALAVNCGDAAAVFGLGPDDRVRLGPA